MAYNPYRRSGLFTDVRAVAYILVILMAGAVLGLIANFATKFLPHIHRDFLIFALIVSPLTMVALSVIVLRSQPRWDVLVLFVLASTWVAMGSWSADIIAHVECDSLGDSRIPTKNNGTMSYQMYCREMKAVLALSWTCFVLLSISMAVLIALVIRVLSLGHRHAWEESMSDIPWFNQYYGNQHGGYPMSQYGYLPGPPIQTGPNQYVVQQAPGHAVHLGAAQMPGMAPTIVQTPMG